MLDIEEEFKKYEFTKCEHNSMENKDSLNSISALLQMFTKAYERIGKEQYKTSSGLEEILDILEESSEEIKDKQVIINELQEREKTKDHELTIAINTIISIADMFEYINVFINKSGMESLKAQFNLVSEQLAEKLSGSSITVLGVQGLEFDMSIHQAIATEYEEDKQEGVILQVVKRGYMYNGKLFRKAEVVINKKK